MASAEGHAEMVVPDACPGRITKGSQLTVGNPPIFQNYKGKTTTFSPSAFPLSLGVSLSSHSTVKVLDCAPDVDVVISYINEFVNLPILIFICWISLVFHGISWKYVFKLVL